MLQPSEAVVYLQNLATFCPCYHLESLEESEEIETLTLTLTLTFQ